MSPAIESIDVRGSRLQYRQQGSGEPLVFIHGSVGDMDDFFQQFDAFSEFFRCVVYTRRYHTPSEIPKESATYAMRDHADDLLALCNALDIHRPHIVSSSWGGYIALLVLAGQPRALRSLVLGEPPMLPLLRSLPGGKDLADAFDRDAITPAREAFRAGDLRRGLEFFMGGIRGGRSSFDTLPEVVRRRLYSFAPEMKLELLTDRDIYMPSISTDELASIDIPTLVLSGEQSPRMFQAVADELARVIPHAEKVIVPKSGHIMHMGNPSFYNEKVLSFLRRDRS